VLAEILLRGGKPSLRPLPGRKVTGELIGAEWAVAAREDHVGLSEI